jgi:hypothetical protein
MQYETCLHIKVDGAYCGSPSLKNRKYCHYHLLERGRRLRRARALRDNVPYRLDIPSLRDFDAVEFALTEITQAVGSGQLDHRAAGKMLYAIQQATSLIKFRAKLQAAQSETMKDANDPVPQSLSRAGRGIRAPLSGANLALPADAMSRVTEYPGFEQEFGITAGTDVDAEITSTLRKADEQAELRLVENFPAPGMRLGSPQYRIYREECYQAMTMQLNNMKHDLRDYHEMKRKELVEQLKKDGMLVETKKAVASATPVPGQRNGSA